MTNGANLLDAELSNFATLSGLLSAGPLGGKAVSIKDSLQYYPAGNVVGFVVSYGSTLLTATIPNNLQLRTYRNNVLQETATFNSGAGVLKATALGASGGNRC